MTSLHPYILNSHQAGTRGKRRNVFYTSKNSAPPDAKVFRTGVSTTFVPNQMQFTAGNWQNISKESLDVIHEMLPSVPRIHDRHIFNHSRRIEEVKVACHQRLTRIIDKAMEKLEPAYRNIHKHINVEENELEERLITDKPSDKSTFKDQILTSVNLKSAH